MGEQNPDKKGVVFCGSLEDAIRSKEKFVESSVLYCNNLQTEIIDENNSDHATNIAKEINRDANFESDKNIIDKEEEDVKVKLELMEFEVKHKTAGKKIKVHSCEECDFKDTNTKVLQKHVTLEHGRKEKPYKKCKFCMEEFQMKKDQIMNSRYRNHLEKLHGKLDLSEFKDSFDKMDCLRCSICDKAIYGSKPNVTINNLKRHIKDKHENGIGEKEMVSCPKCDKSVNSKYLKKHIEITHNEAKFSCEYCGKSFKNKQQMRLHIKVHSSDPTESFKCDICDEMIPQSGSLRLHMYLKHGGRKFNPVTCDECGKQLSDKSKLTKHKDSVHLNKKPFKCDICDLSVSRIDNLKQHKQKVHKLG